MIIGDTQLILLFWT